jgi:hypothetical protein
MGDKKQFSSPSAYARNRRGRKIAGIVGACCAAGAGIVVLMSYLMPTSGFVAKISYDKKAEEAAFLRLRGNKNSKGTEQEKALGQETSILREEEVTNAYPTDAEHVLSEYQKLKDAGKLDGAQVISKQAEEGESEQSALNLGVFYTFYLSNTAEKDLSFNLSLSYSNYRPGSTTLGTSLYSYLRVLICVDEGAGNETHHWFAMASATHNEYGDTREAVSKYSPDIEGNRIATFADGDTYYCTEFDIENKLFGRVDNLVIAPNKETRFTVAVYLEGWDPDCKGQPNLGESLAISAEFALN